MLELQSGLLTLAVPPASPPSAHLLGPRGIRTRRRCHSLSLSRTACGAALGRRYHQTYPTQLGPADPAAGGRALFRRRPQRVGHRRSQYPHAGALYDVIAPAEAEWLADNQQTHYTPNHGNWRNIAEIALRVLSRQCLNRRVPVAATVADEVHTGQRATPCDRAPVGLALHHVGCLHLSQAIACASHVRRNSLLGGIGACHRLIVATRC